MVRGHGEGEATGIYSGHAEIHATVRSRDFRHASRIEPLRDVSPYVQRCSSTHSAGSDRAIKSTDACRCAFKCFSGIASRHVEINKKVRHVLKDSRNAPRLRADEEFPGRCFAGKMKPTEQVLEAFRGLLLGLCRIGTFTDESKASVLGWPIVVIDRKSVV